MVAIKPADAPLVIDPAGDTAIGAGDRIVVIGDRDAVRRLADLAAH